MSQLLTARLLFSLVIMPFLKEGEIRRRKKCSEHLKELDRNVGETEVDQTDANSGTDYKDIWLQNKNRAFFMTNLDIVNFGAKLPYNVF
jgi:hypothetical protein